MSNTYRKPVKVIVEKEVALTVASLNKVLIVTDDKNADFKYYNNSKDVATDFGNNSKVYKLVEAFLGQKDGDGNILKPDFFGIVGVEIAEKAKAGEKLKEVLNENLDKEWYAFLTTFDSTDTIKKIRPFLTENRRIYITEVKAYPIEDTMKSDRIIAFWSPKMDIEENREYKAASYAGVVITKGAGYRVSLIELAGVTADTELSKKVELTKNNITFPEKRTSENYIVANGGKALDGTYLDETSALDCIIVNMNENLEKVLIKKGFKQDDRGYALIEETLHKVMKEMGKQDLIAIKDEKYEYIVYPVTQTNTEREQRLVRPRVLFRLAEWGYFVDLTLQKTFKDIGGK